jgi:hydroxypyruvate isomerase
MLRLSPNLEFLYVELPFLERFDAARKAGFDTVEMHWVAAPGRGGATSIGTALRDAGLTLDAFDAEVGDLSKGDRGWAADGTHGGEERFRASIEEAAANATALGTRKVHVLAGLRNPSEDRETQLARVTDRFAWAAERLNAAGITPVTELLNPYDNPGYVIESIADVERFVDAIGADKIRIEFDFYHLQRVSGELLNTYRRLLPKTGHIQIADAPGRNEPGTGEIDYRNVLAAVDASGYDGHIGLEYRPKTTTEAALAWIEDYGLSRGG